MKCKQCGWENPDTNDRCEKCNNLLIKPRLDESQPSAYDKAGLSAGYGSGYAAGAYQRPYNSQPYNGQTYNGQPYNGQPYNGQGYNSQPYNGQAYNNRPYNGQPYNDMKPSYPDMPPAQPQSPSDPGCGQQYGYSQPEQFGARPEQPQYAPQPEPREEERYCPECDAELPAGATECPVCHTRIEMETIIVVEGVCPDCGTEVAPVQKFCHNCGARLMDNEKKTVSPMPSVPQPDLQPRQTVQAAKDMYAPDEPVPGMDETESAAPYNGEDPDDTVASGPLSGNVPECSLQMIDGSGEQTHTVCCVGAEVELYRGNTDPANNTIARDLQARLSYADGKWSIEDCSALQTTFIRPARKIELHDGDIIVMGNREFIFKS